MKTEHNPMRKALEALANHPRCGAHCKTTGAGCKSAAMPNGRCRMHGGKSTGRPITHGQRTNSATANRQEVEKIHAQLNELIGDYPWML